MAALLPFRRVAKLAGGHAQGREHGSGALVVDGVVAQTAENLREQVLDNTHVVERGQGESPGGVAASGAGSVGGIAVGAGVEVTLVVPVQGG